MNLVLFNPGHIIELVIKFKMSAFEQASASLKFSAGVGHPQTCILILFQSAYGFLKSLPSEVLGFGNGLGDVDRSCYCLKTVAMLAMNLPELCFITQNIYAKADLFIWECMNANSHHPVGLRR